MVYHDSDKFLTELTSLLKISQQSQTGSVLFTYKRFTPHADASVRMLQRSSISEQKTHKHSRQNKNNNNSNHTTVDKSKSIHPVDHVDVNTEPVLLIHVKYKNAKLSTTVNDKHIKSFIRSINAIMTVHNTLLENNQPIPRKIKRKLLTNNNNDNDSNIKQQNNNTNANKDTATTATTYGKKSKPSTQQSSSQGKKQAT